MIEDKISEETQQQDWAPSPDYNLTVTVKCFLCGMYQAIRVKILGRYMEVDPDSTIRAVPKIRNSVEDPLVPDREKIICEKCLIEIPGSYYVNLLKVDYI